MTDETKAPLNQQLYNAVAEIAKANDHYQAAVQRTRRLQGEETGYLNILNEKQRAFDALVKEVKKTAPRDSNWHREKNPGHPVP